MSAYNTSEAIFHLLRDERYTRYNLVGRRVYTEDVIEHFLRYLWGEFQARYGEHYIVGGDITGDEYHIYLDLSGAMASLPEPLRTVVSMWADRYKDHEIKAWLIAHGYKEHARGSLLRVCRSAWKLMRGYLENEPVVDSAVFSDV